MITLMQALIEESEHAKEIMTNGIDGWKIEDDDSLVYKKEDLVTYDIPPKAYKNPDWIPHMMKKTWVDMNVFLPMYFNKCLLEGVNEIKVNINGHAGKIFPYSKCFSDGHSYMDKEKERNIALDFNPTGKYSWHTEVITNDIYTPPIGFEVIAITDYEMARKFIHIVNSIAFEHKVAEYDGVAITIKGFSVKQIEEYWDLFSYGRTN